MILWLVRHAAAEDRADWQGASDDHRPLSSRGRERFRALVSRLGKRPAALREIVTSPAVRAVQTAELLAGARGFSGEVTIEALLCPDAGGVARAVASLRARDVSLAAVGHEPMMSALAARLLGLDSFPARFPKGAIVALEMGKQRPEVDFIALPRRKLLLGSLDELAKATRDG